MNDRISAGNGHPSGRGSLKSGLRTAALVLCAALPAAPLLAESVADNVVRTSQSPIAWMSGGVGDEERGEMLGVAANYNVHLVFSEQRGAYLANVPFSVGRPDGSEIHSGISDGPLLYLQLPPGSYRVSAQINDVWQSKRIRVNQGGRITRLSFIARNE